MDFPLHRDEHRTTGYKQILTGAACSTLLNRLFFSPDNIQAIQNAVRYKVWEASRGAAMISRQPDDEVAIVMRSVYLQFGKNRPDDITGQIRELNDRTVREIMRLVVPEIHAYTGYLKDKFGPMQPMARPVNVNSAGQNQLRSVTSTF